jgi:two-component system sensor histidine kinase PhcS
MHGPDFHQAYAEQNRRDQITYSTLATMLSIILNLFCSVMDHYVYPEYWWLFFKARLCSIFVVILVWFWFQSPIGRKHHRIYGVMWYASPLVMILWLIYRANDPHSPYYAGLNIVLLAVGLLSPWTYIQNLISSIILLVFYVIVCFLMATPQPLSSIINNTTFLLLTAAIVVGGSVVNSRQRYREFSLRFELDKNRKSIEESNRNLETTNAKLAEQNLALAKANQETRAAEMQLVQSEKLASLGRFSAGLMHDVLNPLNYAKTGTFTLRKKCRNLPPELKEEFEAILTDVDDGLKRVDNLVSDLRTFTHPGGQAAEDADVNEVLNMALKFVNSELNEKNVRVEAKVAPGQKAWISRNHLILVLVNLMENAIDALQEKTFAAGERPVISILGESKNGRSFLRVRDNGPGIAPENLSKVFDPFYTTKDVGKGTGLGLSICFGIMRGYSGSITVVSEPGNFCEFSLELPCSLADVTDTEHAEPIRL